MSTLTVDDLLPVIETAISRAPEQYNPVSEGDSCLNTDPNDPSLHCIAAQVLVDLGFSDALDLADNEGPITTTIENGGIGDRFTDGAVQFLYSLQSAFDTATHNDKPWKQAWKEFQVRIQEERGRGIY
jgi:hypothetical protein